MLYYIWLSTIKGIGPIIQKRLLQNFKSPKNIYDADEEEIKKVVGIGDILSKSIKKTSLEEAEKTIDRCHKLGIKILTYEDVLYPEKAKEALDSPIVLYYKGIIKENVMGVGIVGSRKCTDYGKDVTKQAARYLAENGVTVISGMAKGIDGYAHTACLKVKGYTLAFLGSSVDICYPKEHSKLMEGIIESGAVISEYPPTTEVRAEYFPRRNMLISSFSNKLLVVEATHKSGALITANFAKELNREVYAVPNSIYSNSSLGTNELIEKGAKIYLRPSQLLDYIEVDVFSDIMGKVDKPSIKKENKMKNINTDNEKGYSPEEGKILDFMKDSPKTLREIAEFLKRREADILDIISVLEINGDIRALPGGRLFERKGGN